MFLLSVYFSFFRGTLLTPLTMNNLTFFLHIYFLTTPSRREWEFLTSVLVRNAPRPQHREELNNYLSQWMNDSKINVVLMYMAVLSC